MIVYSRRVIKHFLSARNWRADLIFAVNSTFLEREYLDRGSRAQGLRPVLSVHRTRDSPLVMPSPKYRDERRQRRCRDGCCSSGAALGKLGNFAGGQGCGASAGAGGRFRRAPGGRRPRERRAAADPRARADRSPFYALFPAPRAAAAANPAGPRRGRRPQIASQPLPTDSLSAPQRYNFVPRSLLLTISLL